MPTVTAIFSSSDEAREAIASLEGHGFDRARVSMLAPADDKAETALSASERTGATVGAVLGLGASTFLIPGLGPIAGVGMIAAGLAGAALGAAAGDMVERTTGGVPNEEMYFYEEALRQHGAVVFVEAKDEDQATQARNLMQRAGGRPLQAVRRDWWAGLRDAERDYLQSLGHPFERYETDYRSGFEAALHPATRGRSYEQSVAYVETCYPGPCRSEAFRIGFDRGQQYLSGQRAPRDVR